MTWGEVDTPLSLIYFEGVGGWCCGVGFRGRNEGKEKTIKKERTEGKEMWRKVGRKKEGKDQKKGREGGEQDTTNAVLYPFDLSSCATVLNSAAKPPPSGMGNG